MPRDYVDAGQYPYSSHVRPVARTDMSGNTFPGRI